MMTADHTDFADEEQTGTGLLFRELSQSIIGSAMTVLNELKPGLDEKLYENALAIELRARGHNVTQQRSFPVKYRDQLTGSLVPNMIVDNRVIVDAKVATAFNENHIAQMIGYLAITNLGLALLLNFKTTKLQWRRVIRQDASHRRSSSVQSASSAVKF